MPKQMFSVKGMHCSACVMTLEGLEDELAGIRSLKVSLHKQRAEIDYDEKTISEDEIRRAFERAGYGLARA
jgi:copper chaperone CopZ